MALIGQHATTQSLATATKQHNQNNNNNNQNEMQHRDFVECLPKQVQLLSALDGKNRILE